MKIALLAATGRAGKTALVELISRGHEVIAVARDLGKFPKDLPSTVTTVQDDLSDVDRIAEIIKGADAVVSAVGAPRNDPNADTDVLLWMSERILAAVRKAGVPRLIVVGGCGSLWFSPGLLVVDSEYWPKHLVPIARSHMKVLETLKASDINWTYVSPPMLIDLGVRTGTYRTGTDDLIKDENGKSWMAFEDYAIALVDELEKPKHERARFSVGH
jgi:putative NADH-flavin reductase